MLGISVEPEQQVESQMNDLRFNGGNGMEVTGGSGPSSSTSKQPDLEMVLQIAPKIGEYLYNIMGSFFDDRPPNSFFIIVQMHGNQLTIPLTSSSSTLFDSTLKPKMPTIICLLLLRIRLLKLVPVSFSLFPDPTLSRYLKLSHSTRISSSLDITSVLKKWLDSFQSKLKTQGVGILDKD